MQVFRRSEIVLGFLVASVFWAAVLGWQAANAPTETEKQICYAAANKSGHKTEDCKSLWERTTSDPVALFTFGLFIFTGALAISTGFLWKATRDAARGGERAANVAEQALIKLERAFIFIKDFRVSWQWYIDDENRFWWGLRPIFENAGSSASTDLVTNINFELRDSPLPGNFAFPLATESFNAIIGPKSQLDGGQVRITGEELLAIQNGEKRFYIWGLLRYNDIFENTDEHVTTFCREITNVIGNPIQRPTPENNPVRFFFAMHNRYNSAD